MIELIHESESLHGEILTIFAKKKRINSYYERLFERNSVSEHSSTHVVERRKR